MHVCILTMYKPPECFNTTEAYVSVNLRGHSIILFILVCLVQASILNVD